MNTNTLQNINVGVDTGKTQLDIYIRPLDIYFNVTNDEKASNKPFALLLNIIQNGLLLKQPVDWRCHSS